ncbi:uncharacterized protein LOC117173627 [Belonocnema kinseyi]|uniref:uncharacterized protein LOC117173627 n=1 Tax=Belonocnema kinseyi TaxID=2817044 RepID=UPI00143DDAD0|nr:uncharacterized protein LOC117173627 [Belonocnema kinseyi]
MVVWRMKRAWNFEEKLRRKEGSKIAEACAREVMDKERRDNVGCSKWEEEIYEVRRECGINERGKKWEEIEEEMKARQGEEIWEKIADSRFNSWYRMVKGQEKPEYLKKIKKESK